VDAHGSDSLLSHLKHDDDDMANLNIETGQMDSLAVVL